MSLRDKLHILVVDDMSTSRGLLTQALDELGIKNYRTEADGHTAWSSLASKPVHLVISDFNMPRMDGLQLLEAIRSHRPIGRGAAGWASRAGASRRRTCNRHTARECSHP